jgi:hypothetical protein
MQVVLTGTFRRGSRAVLMSIAARYGLNPRGSLIQLHCGRSHAKDCVYDVWQLTVTLLLEDRVAE